MPLCHGFRTRPLCCIGTGKARQVIIQPDPRQTICRVKITVRFHSFRPIEATDEYGEYVGRLPGKGAATTRTEAALGFFR